MSRTVVAIDASVGVAPEAFVAAWAEEPRAAQVGKAEVERSPEGASLPGATELVVIPLAVNIAAAVAYDLVRLVLRRAARGREASDPDITELTTAGGDRVVVARARREVS